jgi:hypothetical protein
MATPPVVPQQTPKTPESVPMQQPAAQTPAAPQPALPQQPPAFRQPPEQSHAQPPVQPPVQAGTHTPGNPGGADPLNDAEREEMLRRTEERRRRLRSMSIRPSANIEELEGTPAYLRRNVHLTDVPHSSEPAISRYHLGDGDDTVQAKPNTYLYDNVD